MRHSFPLLTRLTRTTTLALAVASLGACALPVAQTQAGLTLPAQWRNPSPVQAGVDATWWQHFHSAELVSLIQAAHANSQDVAAAMARVRQADAQVRIAGASLLPQVSVDVSAERYKQVGIDGDAGETIYSAYPSASYEVDLWGANRATRQAALANLQATQDARDTVLLTLSAGVADTYLQTVALREQADLARQDLGLATRILALVESQYRAGAATAQALAQQRTLVAQLGQTVLGRDQQAQASLVALATLLGRAPQGFTLTARSLDDVAIPQVGAGVPADLITRRPDLAQAERQLAAADADVTVARAAMLPSLTLTAYVGGGGASLSDILRHPIYDLAAGLAAPIFSGGRLAAGHDLALAQREEVLANYRSAILAALGDVQSALDAQASLAAQQQAQDTVLAQAHLALRLTQARYRAGAETLTTLLDAQRTLYDAQDAGITIRLERLQAAVALYKALGGGWQADGSQAVAS